MSGPVLQNFRRHFGRMGGQLAMPRPPSVAAERAQILELLGRRRTDAAMIANVLGLATHIPMLFLAILTGVGDVGYAVPFHLAGIASCLMPAFTGRYSSIQQVVHSILLFLYYALLLRYRIDHAHPVLQQMACLFTSAIIGMFSILICPYFNALPALLAAAMTATLVWATANWDGAFIPLIATAFVFLSVTVCQRLLAVRIVQAAHLQLAVEHANAARAASDKAALAKDLEVAAGVQDLLLPKHSTFRTLGLELSCHYQAAAQAGGDWWWFDEPAAGTFRLFIGDVTGHGAGAAMITALVAGTYRGMGGAAARPEALLAAFDKCLRDVSGGEYMMTMAVIEISLNERRVSWWTAGAPPFFLVEQNGELKTVLQSSNPLGSGELLLARGNRPLSGKLRLVVYTDGGLDFQAATRTQGRRAVRQALTEAAAVGHLEAHLALLAEIRRYGGEGTPADDVTVVTVDIRPEDVAMRRAS